MKVFKAIYGDCCSECEKPMKKGLLIGEHSHDFEHDTMQAYICPECVKRGLKKLEEDKDGS